MKKNKKISGKKKLVGGNNLTFLLASQAQEAEEAKKKKEEAEAVAKKKKEEAEAVAKKKKEEEDAAAAVAKKKKEEEDAAAAVAKKKKEEEDAAAVAKKKKEEEDAATAAAAKKKKEDDDAAAAAVAKKKKEDDDAAAAAAIKKKEEDATAAAVAKKKEEDKSPKKKEGNNELNKKKEKEELNKKKEKEELKKKKEKNTIDRRIKRELNEKNEKEKMKGKMKSKKEGKNVLSVSDKFVKKQFSKGWFIHDMALAGKPITRKKLIEQHRKQSIENKKTKKRQDKRSKVKDIKVVEKKKGLFNTISAGYDEGVKKAVEFEKMLKSAEDTVLFKGEKGKKIVDLVTKSSTLGKDIKKQMDNNKKKQGEKKQKELKDAQDKCDKYTKELKKYTDMEEALRNENEFKLAKQNKDEWCNKLKILKDNITNSQLKKESDVQNEISCRKDNTPGHYHDKEGCVEGQFCKLLEKKCMAKNQLGEQIGSKLKVLRGDTTLLSPPDYCGNDHIPLLYCRTFREELIKLYKKTTTGKEYASMGRKKTWRAGTDKNDIESRMENSLYFYKLIEQTKNEFLGKKTCQYYASVYCKNCKNVYCEYCKFAENTHFKISGNVAGGYTWSKSTIQKGPAQIEADAEKKAKPNNSGGKKTKKKTKKNKKKKTKKLQIGGTNVNVNVHCTKAIEAIKAIAKKNNTTKEKEIIERNYMSIDDLFKESPEYLKKLDILRFENCVPKKRKCESLYKGGFIDNEATVLKEITIKSTETDTTKWYQIDKDYLYDFDKYKTNQELENKLKKAIDKIERKPSTVKDSIHFKQVEWFQDFIEKKRSLFTETLETELKNMIEKFESASKEYRKELRVARSETAENAAKKTKDDNFISECLAFDTDIEKENKLKESISFIDTEDYRYHKLLTLVMEGDVKAIKAKIVEINKPNTTEINPADFQANTKNINNLKITDWEDNKAQIYDFIKNTNFFIFGDKIENYKIYRNSDLFKEKTVTDTTAAANNVNTSATASVFLTHLNTLISRMKTSKAKIKTDLSEYKKKVKKAMEQVGKDNSNCTLFVRKPMEELKKFTEWEKEKEEKEKEEKEKEEKEKEEKEEKEKEEKEKEEAAVEAEESNL